MTPITLDVKLEDGRTETVVFRGIPIRSFGAAERAHSAGDEIALIGLSCDRPPDWGLRLDPDSLAPAAAAMQQVNPAFFAWLGRRRVMQMGPAELLRMKRDLDAELPPALVGGEAQGDPGVKENTSPSVVT